MVHLAHRYNYDLFGEKLKNDLKNPYRRTLLIHSLNEIKTNDDAKIEILGEHLPQFIGGLINALGRIIQGSSGVKRPVDIYKAKKAKKSNDRIVTLKDGRKIKMA